MKQLSLLLLFLISLKLQAQKYADPKPNIILIMADDLGYGDLGCYGQQKIATPNIDKLAKSGMQFYQFYAGSAVCAPSRAALMTGLHTGHTAIRGNKGIKPEGQVPLPATTFTIAKILEKNGYNTAAFGKWGLGYPGSGAEPFNMGFKTFFGYNCQTLAHNYYPDHLWSNDKRIEYPQNEEHRNVYSPDIIQKASMDFIHGQNAAKPFFLFLPYTLPHADLTVPHDSVYMHYVNAFNEKPLKPKATNEDPKNADPYHHAAYAAMVSRLDKYVGEIVAAITKKGLLEKTLIIFTSDNGPHKEGGNDPYFFNSNGGLNGIKRDLYEGGIRVPFISSWKGVIKPGKQTDFAFAMWDLYPTFQLLANSKISKNIDGISLVSLLRGGKAQLVHNSMYWELHESGGKQAVRMGEWKGIKLNVNTNAGSPMELYNLSTDMAEKYNVADQHPEIIKRLEAIMKKSHIADKAWPLLPDEIKK